MKYNNRVFFLLLFMLYFAVSCATSKEARLGEEFSKAGNWDGDVLEIANNKNT